MKRVLFFFIIVSTSVHLFAANDGDGAAVIDFNGTSGKKIEVVCGAVGTWAITYIVPEGGLPINGGIRIFRKPNKYWLGQNKQTNNPKVPDYFTMARSDGGNLELAYLPKAYKDHAEAQVKVKDTPMASGSKIILTFGDRSQGGLGSIVPFSWQPPCVFYVESDLDGDGKGLALKDSLVIVPVAGKIAKLVVQAPSIIRVGQKTVIHIRAEDKGGNFIDHITGDVNITCSDNQALTTKTLALTNGLAAIEMIFKTPGIQYVDVELFSEKVTGISNPVKVTAAEPYKYLYCGDLHLHTEVSDGTGSLDFNYQYARDISWLDFVAVTDHLGWDKNNNAMVMTDSPTQLNLTEWNKIQGEKAHEYYQVGKFVTFFAYEWSGKVQQGGDHNIYYLNDGSNITCHYNLNDQYTDIRSIKDQNTFIIPHVGGRIADPAWHGTVIEPCIEINSMHGHFEWFAQKYLQKGYKVGFIGSSDGHFGLPGNDLWANHGRLGLARRDISVPQGTIMVYAKALSREAIRDAIYARHTYATTNVRILLDVNMDEHMMGDVYQSSSFPKIHISAAGTDKIARIEIIRNQQRIFNRTVGTKIAEVDFTDEEPVSGQSYYYVRLSQSDGEIAWSSPIFFSYTGTHVVVKTNPVPWNYEAEEDEPGDPAGQNYLTELTDYLNLVSPNRFFDLKQVRTVNSSRGDYALFYGYDKKFNNAKIHVRWYLGFDAPRMHSSFGWRDFGPIDESNKGTSF